MNKPDVKFENMETIEKEFYICDPDKHTDCQKQACKHNGGPCMYTTHKEYALFGTLPIKKKITVKQNEILTRGRRNGRD